MTMSSDKPNESLLKWFEKLTKSGNDKLNKTHYLIILGILGIALMLFSNVFKNDGEHHESIPVVAEEEDAELASQPTTSPPSTMIEYERYYEEQLKEVLETIAGVEDVSIIVNVESAEKVIYEKNVVNRRQITNETDANGGKRTVEDISVDEQMVFTRDGDRDVPIIYTTEKPDIKGVLIVAKGADDIHVKKNIVEAVMRTLDVPSHRVSVQAKK